MKTFAEHLQELKVRLMVCLAVLGAGSLVGFLIHKPVEAILQKPLGQTLYYSNPAGGLGFVMQISLCVGILLALPLLMFQLMQFSRPAIKPIKSRMIALVIASSFVLTILGVVYAYVVSLPAALHFLTTFNSDGIKALISVNDYLKFLFAYILGTVLAFQLPLILFFANKIRRFPPGSLLRLQRPAIVGAIIFAGVVTPTVDPINQMLVALPIIALFEIGAFAVVVSNKVNKPVPSFEIKMPEQLVRITPSQVSPVNRPLKPAVVSPVVVSPVQIAQPKTSRRPVIMDILSPGLNNPIHG